MGKKNPLVVIVGETASGKSALAFELAKRFNGEIVCADSRTIYVGMDIGTAKPTAVEQSRIRHHCLDLITPDERFTAAEFKRLAEAAVNDIASREKLPIMVGGTGLYVDAVLYNFAFRPPADPSERERIGRLSVEEMQAELNAQNIALPANSRNPRHLARALETKGEAPKRGSLRETTLVIGLVTPREISKERIAQRVAAMIAAGLEKEAHELIAKYGEDAPGLMTIGYREWKEYFTGRQTLHETEQLIVKNTVSYAKRQRTWFKRNNSVQWLSNRDNLAEAVEFATTLLNN